MCKIVALTNSKNIDIESAANKIGSILLGMEKDGFGYAVHGQKGQFGEKCVAPKFESRLKFLNLPKLPFVKKKHEFFGEVSPAVGPAIFHGRTSTNDHGLTNCHPMRMDGWSLVHNGVVTDFGEQYKKQTTNDSEDVLKRFIEGIQSVEQNLSGYYAFTAISPDGRLHIVRDDSPATLFIAWSDQLDTYIIATNEVLLKRVAKALKTDLAPIEEISDSMYMIFNGNEPEYSKPIGSMGWTDLEAQFAEKSLGTNIIDVSIGSEGLISRWTEQEIDDDEAIRAYDYELTHMDASYSIFDEDGKPMTVFEFRKMDKVNRTMCTVIRGDGTVVVPEFNEDRRKSG